MTSATDGRMERWMLYTKIYVMDRRDRVPMRDARGCRCEKKTPDLGGGFEPTDCAALSLKVCGQTA